LDRITAAVRAFYEAYPYPPGKDANCDGYHAQLLLSYLERPFDAPCSLQVLEAGCGRGVNLAAAAKQQRQHQFTGIDINRVAIDEASKKAVEQGASNLQFCVADLLNEATLPEYRTGYDVIISYGVLHHLSDPVRGLRQLTELLAPHGVMGLMVDGSYGRQPLDRYLQALEIIESKGGGDGDDAKRFFHAQALARVAEQSIFKGNYWQGTAQVDEVEFADRCLHVHAQSYDIKGLWNLLESAGLSFVRWQEHADWSLEGMTNDPQLVEQLQKLDKMSRYQVIERLAYRPKLTLIAAKQGDSPRKRLLIDEILRCRLAINPQLKMCQSDSCWRLRNRSMVVEPAEEMILLQLKAFEEGVTSQVMLEHLAETGINQEQGIDLLYRMHNRELLYRPHQTTRILS
jgi:2-polyprenyl-3-methyl-5-hydroxy-6-metoxy-1,4-benzoquinol methylase